MNFVGHIEVARMLAPSGQPSAGFLLGAALPDLAAMGRFRLRGRPGDSEVGAGIDLHHRTDDAFHRHPLFRVTSGAASTALTDAGLSRGAARACGHVGIELLLDGHLLGQRADLRAAVESAIEAASERSTELTALVEADRQTDWKRHLERVSDWPIPDDYHRPEAVARRLQRILSRRPRLSFSPAEIDTVAEGLDQQRRSVVRGADGLVGDLELELAEPA